MNKTLSPSQAKVYAMHYLLHTSNGFDGYSTNDAADVATDVMAEFLTGGLTFEADVAPHCDEDC